MRVDSISTGYGGEVVNPSSSGNRIQTIITIALHSIFIVTPIIEPFAGPLFFVVSGLRKFATFTYYCITIPNFINVCIDSVRSFLRKGSSVPFKTKVSNFLETVNVFGPNKKEAIKNIATIALTTLSWSFFIASFFVAPQIAFFLCLGISAIALGFAINDLYKNQQEQQRVPSAQSQTSIVETA